MTAPWQHAFHVGFAPLLLRAGLEALLAALEADDCRLLQGATTSPPSLQCVESWPVEAADPLAFCVWMGGIADTVGELEEWWARLCFDCDQALGEPAGCRWFLNWFDETPRGEVFPLLAAEVRLALAVDDLLSLGVPLSRPRLYALAKRAGVMMGTLEEGAAGLGVLADWLEDAGEADMAGACRDALARSEPASPEAGADATRRK